MIQTSGHFYCNHKTASHHSPLKPTPAKKQLLTLPHHRLPMALAPPASTTTFKHNYLKIGTTNHSTAFHPPLQTFPSTYYYSNSQEFQHQHSTSHHSHKIAAISCSSFSPIFSMHSMLHHNSSSHLIQHKASSSRSPHHSIILLNHKST